MKSLVFLSEAFNAQTFRVLSKAEIVKLTAAQKAAYDALLAEFVTWFKTNHPNGMQVKLPISKLGMLYATTDENGAVIPKAAIIVDGEGQPAWVPATHTLKVGQLDVLASACGYANYQMLAIFAATKLRKGFLKFNVSLRVEGDKVVGRDGKENLIAKTHISQDDLELLLSDDLKQAVFNAAQKAGEKLMTDFMTRTFEPAKSVSVGEPQDDDLNP